MSNIVTIGLLSEGNTDLRFLSGVIQRTFEDVAFECKGDIEVYDIQPLVVKKSTFVDEVVNAAQLAEEKGIMVLCIHTDADADSHKEVMKHKVIPALERVHKATLPHCKHLVPVIPVQMMEAWMLADKEFLKREIGTNESDVDLGIARKPETISQPKDCIEEAIRIASSHLPKRKRNELTISTLYSPLGQKIRLELLKELPSYQQFVENVRTAYQNLNYM